MDPFALLTSGAKFDRGRVKQARAACGGQPAAAAAHQLPAGALCPLWQRQLRDSSLAFQRACSGE
jgi:hypothetical protein